MSPKRWPPRAPTCACWSAKPATLANLEGIRGDTVVGDLADPDSLKPALSGSDAVVHVAADYRLWIPDPAAMYRANVDGTRELLRLAREAGVKRFVYTSSVATMHFRTDGIVINEDTPVSLADMVGHYKRSKFMAEQEAVAAAQNGQQVIILNPTTPIGPNDRKPTPTGRIFVDFLNGKFPAYVDTGLNLVDVSEVARAHVLALTKGTPGHRYILGGENLTLKQILDKMSAITGIPSPTVKIPFAIAATYAFFEEWITGRIRGREPRATLEEVRMGRKKMFASSARAEQELGFRIVPVYPAMRAAIEWFRANGYAPAPAAQGPRMTRTAIIAAMPGELKPLVRRLAALDPQRHSTSGPSAAKTKTGKKNGLPPVPEPVRTPPRAPSPPSRTAVPSISSSPSAGPELFATKSRQARPTTSPASSTFAPASAFAAMRARANIGLSPAPRLPTPPKNAAWPPPTTPPSSTWKPPPSPASPPCAAFRFIASKASATASPTICPISIASSRPAASSISRDSFFLPFSGPGTGPHSSEWAKIVSRLPKASRSRCSIFSR